MDDINVPVKNRDREYFLWTHQPIQRVIIKLPYVAHITGWSPITTSVISIVNNRIIIPFFNPNFALENKIENIFTPTSELALEHTDKKRNVKKPLFDRIYDLSVNRYYKAEKDGRWWKINLTENEDKIVIPEKGYSTNKNEKTICLTHDIERGLGHLGIDKDLVTRADTNYLSYIKEIELTAL